MGLVDRVLPLEQVRPEALEKVRSLGSLSQAAFALIKHNRVESVEGQVRMRREEREQSFVERWYSDEARQRLREAMERF